MIKSTGQAGTFFWTISLFFWLSTAFGASADSLNFSLRLQAARHARFENPDSAIQLLNSIYEDAMEVKDTLIAVRSLNSLAAVYGNKANYSASYRNLWKALFLSDQSKRSALQVTIYQKIGRHYAFYKRREKAFHFLDLALSLNKAMVEQGKMEKATLTRRYMAIFETYLELGELQLAQTYLDSCFMYQNDRVSASPKLTFLKLQQAFVYTETGRSKEAIPMIESIIPWIEERLPSYMVLVYSFLGDAYRKEGMDAQGVLYYQKALGLSKQLHSHLDFSVLVREKLADLYVDQNQYQKGYEELKNVLLLDRLFFGSRSEYNRPLLEIQDEFRSAMEAKDRLLKEKRIAELEHENRVRFLRSINISILAVSILLLGILFFYYLRNKHQVEKKLIKLEIQANKELLDIKNRELAVNTLKLIDKDRFLQELNAKVAAKKENINYQEINHLIHTATIGNTDTWKAFEAQFVAVNNGFFETLNERFPNLTQGEKRLCALIKLKLTSKEIASLMRISVESVHKSRYRLRKKLKIEKGGDLSGFMSKIN